MPGIITDEIKEQIRAANPIVEIISSYLGPLKKAGGNFVGLCPFHNEKTPSFNVNPARESFYCFGCHAGGDVFTFVQQYDNITFMEAIRRLAERARIPLEFSDDPEAGRRRHLKEALFDIHEKITQRWQQVLQSDAAGQDARDYLERRGVSAEAIERFRLGAAPDEWEDTVNWARAHDYPPELMVKSGLVIERDQGGGHYDRFRGRLMFPIADQQGRVVAFSGRILNDEAKAAKYVNSPETPLFTKGRVMYGLDKAHRKIADAGFAIVCEGQLDLIRCHVSGVENVVAPQGTALTADHGRILKRYANEAILCFDADNAGQKAAVKALEVLAPAELSVRVLNLPAPHDPDSFIREFGADAFKDAVAGAPEYFNFLIDRLSQEHDPASDRGRRAILHEMHAGLAVANDAVLRDTWLRRLAARFGVSTEAVASEFTKLDRQRKQPQFRREATPAPAPTDPTAEVVAAAADPEPEEISPREAWLLRLFFQLAAEGDEHLVETNCDWLESATIRHVITIHLEALRDGSWTGKSPLFDRFDQAHERALMAQAVAEARPIPRVAEQYHQILQRLRDAYLLRTLPLRFKHPATPEEERSRLLAQWLELKKRGTGEAK